MSNEDSKKPISVDDVRLLFKADGSVFTEAGESINIKDITKDIKLDVGIIYKKTALSDVISLLLRKHNLKEDSLLHNVYKGLLFIILITVYPNATQLVFTDENNFEELRKYLKSEGGMQYFVIDDVECDRNLQQIITLLLTEGFVVEKNGRYYIKGYYLDNLKLTNV